MFWDRSAPGKLTHAFRIAPSTRGARATRGEPPAIRRGWSARFLTLANPEPRPGYEQLRNWPVGSAPVMASCGVT